MRVINLKHKPRPDDYVYIGRRQWCGKELFEASPFANYFNVKRYGREEALRLYEAKLRSRPDLMARLPELKGKTLERQDPGVLVCSGAVSRRCARAADRREEHGYE